MGRNVNISYEKFSTMVEEFEEEIKDLETIFTDVEKKTKGFANYWQGNDSDEILPNLEKLESSFPDINKHNEDYLAYLKEVLGEYKHYDDSASNVAEEGDRSLDINVN